MIDTAKGRVVVGVDGTREGAAALRQAAMVARGRGAKLVIVNVHREAKSDEWSNRYAWPESPEMQEVAFVRVRERDRRLNAELQALVDKSFDGVVGGAPSDLPIDTDVAFGPAGRRLVDEAWRPDDLLVVGSRGGARWRHPLRHSVSRYCITHAHCPVMIVHSDAAVLMVPHVPKQRTDKDAQVAA